MRRNAITSTYKITNSNIKKRIDIKGKQIMVNVDKKILDQMNINSKKTCFITLKDHKVNHTNIKKYLRKSLTKKSRHPALEVNKQKVVSFKAVFYQANITANIPGHKEKVYLGVSETTFKVRYGNHKKSFTKQHHKNDTQLSREYLKVKQENGIPRIKWKVLKKCHA